MLKWLFKSTFYRKIQISLFIFILFPLAIASVFSYSLIREVVVEKVKDSRQNVVNVYASDLNQTVEEIVYATNLYGKPGSNTFEDIRAFKDVGQLSSFENYQRYARISDFLRLSFSKTSVLKAEVFYLNNSNFLISGSNTLEYSFLKNSHSKALDPKWRNTLDPNRIYWITESELGISPLTENESYYFAVRAYKDFSNGKKLGVIFVGIPHGYFKQLFKNLDSGTFLLYDDKKQLIIQYPEKEIGTREGEELKVGATVPASNWKLLYRSSFRNITGEISQTFRFYAISLSISILIFLIISVFIGSSIYKPLNRLRKVAEQFGNENLSVRFPVEGKDEIAVLGNAFNNMLDQIKQWIGKFKKEQEEKRLIELQALFAQIRPHFLINTLNSIKCNLILNNDHIHSRQIDSLMRLLRGYMRVDELTPLKKECELLVDYADIMKMRNDMTLDLLIDIPEEWEDFRVPRLILQPLVENAIIHGFNEDLHKPTIIIVARSVNQQLFIEVRDNGIGMSEEKIKWLQSNLHDEAEQKEGKKHIGLRNVFQRLMLTYGPEVSMDIHNNENTGLSIRISIPIKRAMVND
ncbi:histidine kinase [Priestia megaterium]|uniref:Histidine kinase n=1 Tax=Priestia megaterium TaxID=1404 RepID=A0A6H1P0R6_PRIMG|nr:histidine kinase [Priestia megaterium]QIZ07184.1 histidine kinase [Priestia megaterium]